MARIEREVMACCGLWGVLNLTANDDDQSLLNAIDDIVSASIIESDEPCDCGYEDCDSGRNGSGPGICIATSNESQEASGVGTTLREQGFHAVLNTLNPNSGNRITLWVRDLTEHKAPATLTSVTAGTPYIELRTAVQAYVTSNPNPRTNSAQRLVSRYRELFG